MATTKYKSAAFAMLTEISPPEVTYTNEKGKSYSIRFETLKGAQMFIDYVNESIIYNTSDTAMAAIINFIQFTETKRYGLRPTAFINKKGI